MKLLTIEMRHFDSINCLNGELKWYGSKMASMVAISLFILFQISSIRIILYVPFHEFIISHKSYSSYLHVFLATDILIAFTTLVFFLLCWNSVETWIDAHMSQF